MRLILFLATAITAGAVGVSQGVIPLPPQMVQAILALGGDPAQVKTANINPVDAYKGVLPQIIKGSTPEDLGFHGSAVTIPPGSFRAMTDVGINAGAIGQNGLAANALSQIQQNNIRMQDMANYARNPAAWHGAPPH
ncbi:MAG: hypothetical protein ABSE20_11465 [Acetobacteraceae bacterium]